MLGKYIGVSQTTVTAWEPDRTLQYICHETSRIV
ncbi:hypothetical protein MU540_03425 [Limosilactobacillus fermentum]|nr:hypothetical protein MU540_03425 [Limosilactobacillus fermentum]